MPHTTTKACAKEIAAALGESHQPRIIFGILEALGAQRTWELVGAAQRCCDGDGMPTLDGSRKRTLGGTFFQLVKDELAGEGRRSLVNRPKPASLALDTAVQLAATAAEDPGEVQTVKITVTGRPKRVVFEDGVVVVTLNERPRTALPPRLPKFPRYDSPYTVFVDADQWEPVETALQEADDELIAYGNCFLDPDVRGIGVVAKRVTTRRMNERETLQRRNARKKENRAPT